MHGWDRLQKKLLQMFERMRGISTELIFYFFLKYIESTFDLQLLRDILL